MSISLNQYLNQTPIMRTPTGSVLLERSEYDLDKLGNDYYVDVKIWGEWYRYRAKILSYASQEFATLYGVDEDGNTKGHPSVFSVRLKDILK